jgi:hypothetical protein
MKTYITFGQVHKHVINGQVFDKDCVAVIETNSIQEGRKKAIELFGTQFCFEYSEENFDKKMMMFYPRGFIKAN